MTKDAASESVRLGDQVFRLSPQATTPEVIACASRIDGAVLLDDSGTCHGIGVILDGSADASGERSRGARYNSALRYINAHPGSLALVVSEDGLVNIIIPRSGPPAQA